MIGLKKGTVRLVPHQAEWEEEAKRTMAVLKEVLGDAAVEMAHVGSTSVPSIMAKPIIDIAVATESFDAILACEEELRDAGFYYRPQEELAEQLLFACGSFYEGTGDEQTHFIHVVKASGTQWRDYINFRNYLRKKTDVAKEYEAIKIALAERYPFDEGRRQYLEGKKDFIAYTLRKALVDSYLGKTVRIGIDRPIGYVHPKETYTLVYPINYGYIPGVLGGDGEELDVYLLGVETAVEEYTARIIGIAHRENDVEDKLIAAPPEKTFSLCEMARSIAFQEQYYRGYVENVEGELLFDRDKNLTTV